MEALWVVFALLIFFPLTLPAFLLARTGRLLVVAAALAAFAAFAYFALWLDTLRELGLPARDRYYVVLDTVGNCSVVDSKPSARSGLKIIGDKHGYPSMLNAGGALNGDLKGQCKATIE
jgi:hypothetical protein